MPAPTDHSVRRREVGRAAVHAIAKTGMDGATLRAVADEGGWSVGVVQHYFRNKSQLLIAAVDYLAERTSESLEAQPASTPALDRLTTVLEQIIPARGQKQANYWKVWVCFWAQATTDPLLAKAVEGHARLWRQRLEATIRAGQVDGSIRADINVSDAATHLAACIDGLGISAAVDSAFPFPADSASHLVGHLRP
jgi:AcrR family transcriptional regulator